MRQLAHMVAPHRLPEAARAEVGIVAELETARHMASRHAERLQFRRQQFRHMLGSERRQGAFEFVDPRQPVGHVAEAAQALVAATRCVVRQRLPLRLAANLNDDPFVFSSAGKSPVGRVALGAVAAPRRRLAGGRLGEDALDAKRKQALGLRQVEMLPAPGTGLLAQRGEQRRGAVQAAHRIAERHMHHGRRVGGRTREMRQPRRLLDGGTIGAEIAPRAIGAEGRHGDHHDGRIRLAQHLEA